MKIAFLRKHLLPVLSALMVLLSAFSCVSVLADDSAPVNLVGEEGVLQAFKPVRVNKEALNQGDGAVAYVASEISDDTLAVLHDGKGYENDAHHIKGDELKSSATFYYGVQISFDKAYDLTSVDLDSGYDSWGAYNNYLVYAAERYEDLYKAESRITPEPIGYDICKITVFLDDIKAKHVAVLMANQDIFRLNECWVYGLADTGAEVVEDIPVDILPINVLDTTTNDALDKFKAVQRSKSEPYDVTDSTLFSKEQLDWLHNGEKGQNFINQVNNFKSAQFDLGVEITMDKVFNLMSVNLYDGWNNNQYLDTFSVYASTTLEALYEEESLIKSGVSGNEVELSVNKPAQYIAILATENGGSDALRASEFEVWINGTGEDIGDGEAPDDGTGDGDGGNTGGDGDDDDDIIDDSAAVNLVGETGILQAFKPVQRNKETGAAYVSTVIDSDTLASLHDGIGWPGEENKKHVSLPADWATFGYGVQISFDKAYTLTKVVLDQGYGTWAGYNEYVVYAAEKYEDLYKSTSLITAEPVGLREPQITVSMKGITAKHVAVLLVEDGELHLNECWVYGLADTGEAVEEEIPADIIYNPINVLDTTNTALVEFKGVQRSKSEPYAVTDSTLFSKEQLDWLHDGISGQDYIKQVDNFKSAEFDLGVQITLDKVYGLMKINLCDGYSNSYQDTFSIYASTTLGDLYKDKSLIASDIKGYKVELNIDVQAKYIAILATQDGDYDALRASEFEVWGNDIGDSEDDGSGDEEEVVDTEEELNAALADANAMPDVIGATISPSTAYNILFKSTFNNVQQTVGAYSLVKYGIIVLPTQYITPTHKNYKADAVLEYGNKYLATAEQVVADGATVDAIPEFGAELIGSGQGVYPGVKFSYRAYMVYEKADGDQAIVYSSLDDEHAERSVWSVARAIAEAILENKASLTANITYTENFKDTVTVETLADVASADVYDFIRGNLAAVKEIVAKEQQ